MLNEINKAKQDMKEDGYEDTVLALEDKLEELEPSDKDEENKYEGQNGTTTTSRLQLQVQIIKHRHRRRGTNQRYGKHIQ
jgi:hypothetical protein